MCCQWFVLDAGCRCETGTAVHPVCQLTTGVSRRVKGCITSGMVRHVVRPGAHKWFVRSVDGRHVGPQAGCLVRNSRGTKGVGLAATSASPDGFPGFCLAVLLPDGLIPGRPCQGPCFLLVIEGHHTVSVYQISIAGPMRVNLKLSSSHLSQIHNCSRSWILELIKKGRDQLRHPSPRDSTRAQCKSKKHNKLGLHLFLIEKTSTALSKWVRYPESHKAMIPIGTRACC